MSDPASWRSEVIRRLRLRGEERCAAACPAPGFPQLFSSIQWTLADAPPGVWLDVGGGLGGVAEWMVRRAKREVIIVEPSPHSARGATELFPLLTVMQGTAEHVPVRSASVSAVIINGVVSLIEHVDAVVAEVSRVIQVGGMLSVADLWSADDRPFSAPPNTFVAVEHLIDISREHGLEVVNMAMCEIETGWWSEAATQVDSRIRRRYADEPQFTAWDSDQHHIRRVLESGRVLPGAFSFRKLP